MMIVVHIDYQWKIEPIRLAQPWALQSVDFLPYPVTRNWDSYKQDLCFSSALRLLLRYTWKYENQRMRNLHQNSTVKKKKSRGEEGFMGILHDKRPAKRKMASFGESENAASCARRRNENWKAACKKCRLKARWSWGRSPQQRRKYKGENTFSDLFERASIFREIALDSLLLMDHTFATFFFRFSFSAYPHWEIFAASLPKSDQHHCSRTTAQSSDATYTELEECWPRQHGGENKKEEVQGVVSGKLKFLKKEKKAADNNVKCGLQHAVVWPARINYPHAFRTTAPSIIKLLHIQKYAEKCLDLKLT